MTERGIETKTETETENADTAEGHTLNARDAHQISAGPAEFAKMAHILRRDIQQTSDDPAKSTNMAHILLRRVQNPGGRLAQCPYPHPVHNRSSQNGLLEDTDEMRVYHKERRWS